ncbi:MAG TPA: tetratricopeptide repeat protein [Candidatus Xenobia bacterium]|nr:tetratricopeptide repeat protein [Candidatus Xenobia bacterium]
MRMRRASLLPVVSALILFFTSPGRAQETGAFSGIVLDEAGEPLVGAVVIVRRLEFNLEWKTETDLQGRFYYGGFQPGRYRVSVQRNERVVWSTYTVLPPGGELRYTIDLKKMREEAERLGRLDPGLEQRREAERLRQAREDELERHYTSGARALADGKPEEAIREYQALIEKQPGQSTPHSLLGSAYAAAGRLEEAASAYRRALELEPREAAHHNNLGLVLIRSGQLDDGLRHIERAAQLDPERAATYEFNLGAALLNAGRPGDALAPLRRAVRSDPTFALGQYFLGLALLRTSPRRGEQIDARVGTAEAFQRYLQLAPDGPYAADARAHLKQLGVPEAPAPTPRTPGSRPGTTRRH